MDTNSSVLHASSIDQYYTTQEVVMPTTSSIVPLFSGLSTMENEPFNTNLDEPPSSHQGVLVKILKPVYSTPANESLLQSHWREKRDRETAILLHNGIDTNLIGRMAM